MVVKIIVLEKEGERQGGTVFEENRDVFTDGQLKFVALCYLQNLRACVYIQKYTLM